MFKTLSLLLFYWSLIAFADDDHEKVYFKIQVPEVIHKLNHTKVVYLHIHHKEDEPKHVKHEHHHEHHHNEIPKKEHHDHKHESYFDSEEYYTNYHDRNDVSNHPIASRLIDSHDNNRNYYGHNNYDHNSDNDDRKSHSYDHKSHNHDHKYHPHSHKPHNHHHKPHDHDHKHHNYITYIHYYPKHDHPHHHHRIKSHHSSHQSHSHYDVADSEHKNRHRSSDKPSNHHRYSHQKDHRNPHHRHHHHFNHNHFHPIHRPEKPHKIKDELKIIPVHESIHEDDDVNSTEVHENKKFILLTYKNFEPTSNEEFVSTVIPPTHAPFVPVTNPYEPISLPLEDYQNEGDFSAYDTEESTTTLPDYDSGVKMENLNTNPYLNEYFQRYPKQNANKHVKYDSYGNVIDSHDPLKQEEEQQLYYGEVYPPLTTNSLNKEYTHIQRNRRPNAGAQDPYLKSEYDRYVDAESEKEKDYQINPDSSETLRHETYAKESGSRGGVRRGNGRRKKQVKYAIEAFNNGKRTLRYNRQPMRRSQLIKLNL